MKYCRKEDDVFYHMVMQIQRQRQRQIQNTQIHNKAYGVVPERPNKWHIFEKRIVQGYQKLYSHKIQILTSEFRTVVRVFTPSRKTIQSLHTSDNI